MSETKHTPGPWRVGAVDGVRGCVESPVGQVCASVRLTTDAHLIAAAPEMLEALEAAAVQLGLPAPLARQLATQTAFGAAKLALGSDVDAAELRRRVTSPGGTTEAALKQFDADHFRHIVARAVAKAAARSAELANA